MNRRSFMMRVAGTLLAVPAVAAFTGCSSSGGGSDANKSGGPDASKSATDGSPGAPDAGAAPIDCGYHATNCTN